MRGGAIPVLAWGLLLLVLYVGNWIWDGTHVNPAQGAFATLVIITFAFGLWLARREAIRRGPPSATGAPETVPSASVAAVVAGLSVGAMLLGTVWGKWLVFIGAGFLLASLIRLGLELRAESATRRRADRPAEAEP